jgi:hypothetical protein
MVKRQRGNKSYPSFSELRYHVIYIGRRNEIKKKRHSILTTDGEQESRFTTVAICE